MKLPLIKLPMNILSLLYKCHVLRVFLWIKGTQTYITSCIFKMKLER